jgi:hypothetical protein
MAERDWFGLVRWGVDAATLLWSGPESSLELGWFTTFGEALPQASWRLPLGGAGEVRGYEGDRFVVTHAQSGMAQIRRSPRAPGGATRIEQAAAALLARLLR